MKPIYIRRAPGHSYKIYVILAMIVLALIGLRIAAPSIIEAYINTTAAKGNGYHFRIEDIDLKILKGEFSINRFNMFKAKSNTNYIEAKDLVFDMNPLTLFEKEKVFTVTVGSLDFLVSKDLFEEVNRVKNEAKESAPSNIYLEEVTAKVGTINVRQLRDHKEQSIITLKNARAQLTDLGFGSTKENTEFQLSSAIAEGGQIDVNGKTKLEAENTPWEITGFMKQVPSTVLEKIAGDKLPIDISAANVDASITARSGGGQIEGTIVPDIKDFKLSENKDQGVVKRGLAKASNFLFNKVKGKDEALTLVLPFTLNENFTVDVPDTLQKITK